MRWSIALRRRRRSIARCTTLYSQLREVFLTCLQCSHVLSGGSFKIHSEPHRPDDHPNYASSDILSNLQSLLISELLCFLVVSFNFSPDHRAVRISILRLHSNNWLRVSARARRHNEGDRQRTIAFCAHVIAPSRVASQRSSNNLGGKASGAMAYCLLTVLRHQSGSPDAVRRKGRQEIA